MKKLLLATVALFAVSFVARVSFAADSKSISGVLIDNACGAKQMSKDDPQAEAAKHPKGCCTKDGCAKSGYAVISGKKMLKFDDKGNDLAKAYLAKDDTTTKVVVIGTPNDDGTTIAVTEIKKQEEKK